MCDINVFVVNGDVEEKVLENVDLVETVAGGLRLVNIFGEEKTIQATLVSYDNSDKRMVFRAV
ncbi:MAG TPA: CooT family nickel-binding protein [Desulfosarcina sp.]|nr:CooT family nickel-binding protein [Desulfosarcina sp.]